MAIVQLLQVSLCVRDLARSTRFYRDLLGCREVAAESFGGAAPSAALGLAPTEFRSSVLERDGMRLELIAFGGEPAAPRESAGPHAPAVDRPGLSHITFAVDDLRSTLHSLRDRGVPVLDATLVEQAAGAATCLVADPDGIAVLLYQRPIGAAAETTPLDPPRSSSRSQGGAPRPSPR